MTYDTRGQPTEPPENQQSDVSSVETTSELSTEEMLLAFPVTKLTSLNLKISNPRWVVPVLPEQELECLLNVAIELTEAGIDHESEPCQRFYSEGLTNSFAKILTDDAVNSWKYNIHHCILISCGKLIQLCALHMKRDNQNLLDLLAVVLDPDNKFHAFNISRAPEMFLSPAGCTTGGLWGTEEQQIYAHPPVEQRQTRGWLVDLLNRFGQFGGFERLLERFNSGMKLIKKSTNDEQPGSSNDDKISSSINLDDKNKITLPLIHSWVRPFGLCYELLTIETIEKYFMPIWEIVLELLDGLSDEELKREAKPEGRSDAINGIVRAARCLASRLPNQENLIKELEMFRLKMILRLLQVSSFNGKMNALNEINKVLSTVSYYPQRTQGPLLQPDDEMDWLTAEKMATWIKDSDVLSIVLRDSLHQPQYVEKLEKILRFLIKEKALNLEDLDAIWRAQSGKHEAIVKNVHDLLAKLAWDFNADQLDHLFDCFQASMTTANKKQRERLLELIRRLAEDDKNGVMAHKVLKLFWSLAHSPEIQPEVLDQALSSHVKILDYSCAQERDAQKTIWLDKCVGELQSAENWVLPALRLIREICCLYDATQNQPRTQNLNRQQVIERLQNDHTLVILVTNSLSLYMEKVRVLLKEYPDLKPNELILDGRYPHGQQIQERLDFLKFLLKDGQLWLCADQAKQIWQCLAVNAAFPTDREECFRWFGKLMGDEPDLDPGINKDFFENNLLKLEPQLLTESGIKCFERFFKAVNSKEDKLKGKHRGYVLDDDNLIGKDYLWGIITTGGEEIAYKAIDLLKEVSTALSPRLQASIADFHEAFIDECCERMKTSYKNIFAITKCMEQSKTDEEALLIARLKESEKLCRVVRVLQEYIRECDRTFNGDRFNLPLSRATRGKHVHLFIRFQTSGRPIDDMEITTHSNETVASFRKSLLKRIKGTSIANIKVDLFYGNGELIEIQDDRNPLSHYAIRDKMILTAKLTQTAQPGMVSSPDSSSDSSTGSPPRPCPDMQRPESEATLPGVLLCNKQQYIEFFLQLYQLGSDLEHDRLRESSKNLLNLLPLDKFTELQLHLMCGIRLENDSKIDKLPTPEQMFLNSTPAQVLYNLEVLHAILIPALDSHNELTIHIQSGWLHSGCGHFILSLLTKKNFLPTADMNTKRAAFQCVLRLVKLFLYIVGCVLMRVGDEPNLNRSCIDGSRPQVELLKQVIQQISGISEHTLRSIAMKLAANLAEQLLSDDGEECRQLFQTALKWTLPDVETIWSLVHLSWASSIGSIHMLGKTDDFMQKVAMPDNQDFIVCREALEVLNISLVLNPNAFESLCSDPTWPHFVNSLILINPMRHVRQVASDQLFLSCTYCASDRRFLTNMIKLLFNSHQQLVTVHAQTCAEFFQLLCRILNYGCLLNWPLTLDGLLHREIQWLRQVRDSVKNTGDLKVHEDLLEGHLCLAKELTSYLSPEAKSRYSDLILEIIDEFVFPSSRQYLHLRRTGQLTDFTGPPPVCRSSHTFAAACELLVSLCTHSVSNMTLVVNTLVDMFCSDTEPLKEWEYLPPVGPRPQKGFCGLKNAGATCYMNSVLQQLFMVPSIRYGILNASGAAVDPNEDFSGESDAVVCVPMDDGTNRSNYHVGILKHVQAIFAHLAHSALQFYVPKGLWGHFKLQGEPVNLREQQDAVEFFMSLFESLDDGLKALGHQQLMGATLGGCFSDQKICQGCPHRYSKEEPFSVLSVDIRNHSSLTDSLEQYVKGELLEGADAYHCDKCDKKVVTVKRLCVRKLPPVLAIQLKRFEYDYERVCAIKFNDYFEFPRELDMEPYTVSGLAKLEGEVIDIEENPDDQPTTTKYQLTGIVVHSGQASGGHYFSYILHKDQKGREQWCKFDDGEVTECKMNEDEEMKAQCFGGDYMSEVYDNNLKRMQYRRQKRWWNAYMLFYTRHDQLPLQTKSNIEQLSLAESKNCVLPMPEPIENSVRAQNIRFLHSRSLFSQDFFNFIKKLVICTVPRPEKNKLTPQAEELSLLGVQLASQFLFHSGFRTKKALRGAAIDWYEELKIPLNHWYETLTSHIRNSSNVRRWFAQNTLLNPPTRLGEYILVAPAPEVRAVFVKLVVFFCHFAIHDEPIPGFDGTNLCEQILISVLKLLNSEVSEHGKHLPHYFTLFSMYAGLGIAEKQQLIKLNVPAIFMKVALDEGPGPPIKYQYPELSKLHQVVSHLVRCIDISEYNSPGGQEDGTIKIIQPNKYIEQSLKPSDLMPLSPETEELLFGRQSYIKKLIEDTAVGEDGVKLLQYCSWENPIFSRAILTELLWQSGFAYWHDMRHHTDLLLNILLMDDSWQTLRIFNALLGVAEEREGLLDTIQRAKTHYQKRAYQIIKCVVQLFNKSSVALNLLRTDVKMGKSWREAVDWLQEELDRQRGMSSQYNYSSWSPPAQSNDNTNGYMLERSLSAKNTLQMAIDLCPENEEEIVEQNEIQIEQGDEVTTTTIEKISTELLTGGTEIVTTEPTTAKTSITTITSNLQNITINSSPGITTLTTSKITLLPTVIGSQQVSLIQQMENVTIDETTSDLDTETNSPTILTAVASITSVTATTGTNSSSMNSFPLNPLPSASTTSNTTNTVLNSPPASTMEQKS